MSAQGPTSEPAPRRPDASMSLLSDLMTNALDEGYRRQAARGPAQTSAPAGAGRPVVMVAVFALAGLVLATGAAQTQASAPSVAEDRERLIERVLVRTEAADQLQGVLVALRSEVDRLRDDALAATSAGGAASTELELLATLAGVSPVRGPGIKVVVEDAPEDVQRSDGASGRVLDSDLQRLLNGLWAAGAEAVSVNGQRLTQLSAIRAAGDAILVAYRPLSPPYEVLAIGPPDDLEVDFIDGPGGRWFATLKGFGIRLDVTQQKNLFLPGASGVSLRVAERKNTS
ncbi:MAG: DUF881 domain-containing protein [Sporichthyaceae bacterium]